MTDIYLENGGILLQPEDQLTDEELARFCTEEDEISNDGEMQAPIMGAERRQIDGERREIDGNSINF